MIKLLYTNGKHIGNIYQECDGFYVFIPLQGGGFWTEHSLMFVADKLKEMNKDWNEYIESNLNNAN